MLENYEYKNYTAQQVVFKQEEAPTHIYIVAEGEFELYR